MRDGDAVWFCILSCGCCFDCRPCTLCEKEETKQGRKLASAALAVLLVVCTLWTFNEIYGNPVTKNAAKEAVQEYLEMEYPGKAPYIESVSHNMSAGSYEAWIAGKDGGFYVSWRDGRILYDTFGEIIK